MQNVWDMAGKLTSQAFVYSETELMAWVPSISEGILNVFRVCFDDGVLEESSGLSKYEIGREDKGDGGVVGEFERGQPGGMTCKHAVLGRQKVRPSKDSQSDDM